MWFFGCGHKAKNLVVEKEDTVEAVDADFQKVTHHFRCLGCGEPVAISHSRPIGGVAGFFERGKP